MPGTFTAQGAGDSWKDTTAWGGSLPNTIAPGNLTFINFDSGYDSIVIPPTVLQSTGSGTWTISDTATAHGALNAFTSALFVVNDSNLFVSNTNNFNPPVTSVAWTLTGTGTGAPYFENAGALEVVGGSTSAPTTAFLNINLVGSGQLNLFGDATSPAAPISAPRSPGSSAATPSWSKTSAAAPATR